MGHTGAMPATSALDLERALNPQQLAAVTHGEGPQLVLAGAGSGKTRVITYRISWLVEERGVDPASIVAMTFTNKAADEMRERVEGLLGIYPLPTFVGTFHRYALTLLRRWGDRVGVRRDFTIFDADDQLRLVKQALADEGLAESSFQPRAVRAAISSAKSNLIGPAAFENRAHSFFQRAIAPVYGRYQQALSKSGALDFDDMLTGAVRLLTEGEEIRDRLRRRVTHLLVDEFQDTNHAQLRFVQELIGSGGNLTAVGDEDQGIYRWRGADLDNILQFEKSFPGATIRKLERNYRSTQNILSAADAVVSRNELRRGKTLWTDAGDGERLTLYRARDEQDEARWVVQTLRDLPGEIPFEETAILVRTNAQTRALEEELLARQVPYSLVGGVRFYERAEIKDLVAYLRLLRNPRDDVALRRVINLPPRGIGRTTQDALWEKAARSGVPVWDLLVNEEFADFPTRGANALSEFRKLMLGLAEAAAELPLPALLDRLLTTTGYTDLYDPEDSADQARLENIREFLSAAQDFLERRPEEEGDEGLLTAFLDHASLVTDLDAWQRGDGVSLMTLHSAKGLEFTAVVVAGLEDGLLPHYNAGEAREDLEEERRLLYVGMTRARQRLYLTCCRRRRIAGRYQDQEDSPFLLEVPEALLDVERSSELFTTPRTAGVRSFFSTSSERRYEYDADDSAENALRRGVRVRHATLGAGVVLTVEGEGGEAKITVMFDRAGKRKLMVKHARLERE